MDIRVMTYNICSGHHYVNHENHVLEWNNPDVKHVGEVIKKYNPDIVGLNEVYGKGKDSVFTNQTEALAKMLGYKYYYFAEAHRFKGVNPYGNAILSRFPIKSAEVIKIPELEIKDSDIVFDENRCILHVIIELQGETHIYISHFGLTLSERKMAAKTVSELLDGTSGHCILMGDFNTEPEHELLNPIYERISDTASGHDKKALLTMGADAPYEKIDYIFVRDGIKTNSICVPPEVASDHRPYYADITID